MKDLVGLDDKIDNTVISARNGFFSFRVQGISMQPVLQDGDILIVKYFELSELILGDIIIYQNVFQERIVHRIIKKYIKGGKIIFLARGDNERGTIEYVYPGQILGKVMFVKRMGHNIEVNNNSVSLRTIFYNKRSAFGSFLYSILRDIKYIFRHRILGDSVRTLQSLKIYSCLVKKLIGTSRINYRFATTGDAALLAHFYKIYYWPTRTKILNEISNISLKDVKYCFLAQRKDKIIGSVIIRQFPNAGGILSKWWMYGFFMDWRYRNIGIEEQMIKLAIDEVKRSGAGIINILVPTRDIFSINLFRNLCDIPAPSKFNERLTIFTRNLK